MTKSKSQSLTKVLSIIVIALLCLSSLLFAGCGNQTEERGISFQSQFRLVYVAGEKINIAGEETAYQPDFTGGQLTYRYQAESGKYVSRTVDMLKAYEDYKSGADKATHDYVYAESFHTGMNDSTKTSESRSMTLVFCPMGEGDSARITMEVAYKVYKDQNSLEGAQSVTILLNKVNYVLSSILTPICIVMCSIGTIFAIYLGIKLARANNAEEREEAKKRVVYTVVGIFIGIALIILFQLFASSSLIWFGGDQGAVDFFPRFFVK